MSRITELHLPGGVRVKWENPKESLVQEPTVQVGGSRFNCRSLHDFHHVAKCIRPQCGNQHTLVGKWGFPSIPNWAPLREAQLGSSSWSSLGIVVSVLRPTDVASRGAHLCWHLQARRLWPGFPGCLADPSTIWLVTALNLGRLLILDSALKHSQQNDFPHCHWVGPGPSSWSLCWLLRPHPYCRKHNAA